jgi:hypothetical protein
MKKRLLWILIIALTVLVSAVACTDNPAGDNGKSAEDTLKEGLLERADTILPYLKDNDFGQLAAVVHKDKGVTFSNIANVTKNSVNFTADKLKTLKPTDKSVWGVSAGTGDPIDLSAKEYFEKYVYGKDYIKAPQKDADKILAPRGGMISNIEEAFPGSHFVEYYFPATEKDGVDWESLRLVFEKAGEQWMLVGIVHDSWTP